MAMEISFKGKRALVTGAGKGIGRRLAKKLVECGAMTFALSRTQSDLDSLKKECPNVHTITCDLSNCVETDKAVRACGDIDLLVNNAAVAKVTPFVDIKMEDIDWMYAVNIKAVFLVSQIVAKGMIARGTGGSIVNVSSQAGIAALADHAVYGSTKAGLDYLTKVMGLELGPHKIRVNSVNPTVVNTEMGKVGWSDPAKAAAMTAKIPLGKFAEVEDIVDPILFLLSDKAQMINGVMLPIDGGFLAC